MNVWQQIDELKAKHKKDREHVEAVAKAYGFIRIEALPHGEWTCSSRANQKHAANLRAPNADDLCRQMQETFAAAEKAAEERKKVPA